MSWISQKSAMIAVSVAGAAVSFNLLSGLGIDMTTKLLGTSITPQLLIGAAFVYIIIAVNKLFS
jgi:hypothetical protein